VLKEESSLIVNLHIEKEFYSVLAARMDLKEKRTKRTNMTRNAQRILFVSHLKRTEEGGREGKLVVVKMKKKKGN
jgi:hypothetical protein